MNKIIVTLLSLIAVCFNASAFKDEIHQVHSSAMNKDIPTTVVIPDSASDLIKTAAQEFQYLLGIATGVTVKTQSDVSLTHTADGKYISIGETSLLASSGLTIDREELGADGVRIITKDNTVYLVGGSDYGSLYAVYDFMQIVFHYEIVSNFCSNCFYNNNKH